ncbi:hypothetical protein GCM10010472_61620 [Pseudonocardia halophobica]|uniref:Uncharacterized protein n=1 Tax=Pseudonocardia halophobica TaxID=29401 RepID=A0A9W6L770_9PSEU|nr:hypothetical protein [Pseudonocardia halophobica]GLL14160.1 hypothetical protein GCM10017577_53070 [Pseudonocardia halophobica]
MTEPPDPDSHDEGGLLTRRGRRWLIVVCVLGVLVAVGYAAAQARSSSAGRGPAVAQGQVRLGPDPGEAVPDYLAQLPATLPAPGERAPALVQLDRELTTDAAAALAGSASPAEVVFRVPIPRVQTALRFEILPAAAPVAAALDTARQRAGHAAEADASRLTDRPAAVARAEAAAYAGPCACVVALVVSADRAGLEALAGTPGVRAVEAAPVGVTLPELALSPLLPEQTTAATPLPDDGPVP